MTEGKPSTIPNDAAVPTHGIEPSGHAPRFRVERVPRSGWLLAAERLVSMVAGNGRAARAAAERFIVAAGEHKIDLTGLHASYAAHDAAHRTPRPRQVCLAVPGSGATATFFTTNPESAHDQNELAAVIDAACRSLPETRLAQALLTEDEDPVRRAFEGASFHQICDLAYLSGPMHNAVDAAERLNAQRSTWPAGVELIDCARASDEAIITALRSSYEQTLDCPELCALRQTEDVLTSHRAAGLHDPRMWWLVMHHGKPSGAAFLAPMPEQSAIELVYLGLSPQLRGQGLGKAVLAHALLHARRSRERDFQCAVDLRNTPALKLYAGFGLRETGRRRALVRALP